MKITDEPFIRSQRAQRAKDADELRKAAETRIPLRCLLLDHDRTKIASAESGPIEGQFYCRRCKRVYNA